MSDNPYTAPQSSPQPEFQNSELATRDLASRWARLGASMLDGIIVMVVFLPLLFALLALGLFPGMPDTGKFLEDISNIENSVLFDIIGALMAIALYLVINAYLLVTSGQSVGKKILGIQIVDCHTGQLLPASRVIGSRYLLVSLITQIPIAGSLFGLVDVLFIFLADKRCIHDLIASSCVVRK